MFKGHRWSWGSTKHYEDQECPVYSPGPLWLQKDPLVGLTVTTSLSNACDVLGQHFHWEAFPFCALMVTKLIWHILQGIILHKSRDSRFVNDKWSMLDRLGGGKKKWVSCSAVSDSLWPYRLHLPGSSVHGIFQARILEWVAISFSRGSSWSRDWTYFSHLAGRFVTTELPGKPLKNN